MHLVGPYMTTTNYRKPKQKPRTKVQQAKLEEDDWTRAAEVDKLEE